MNRTHSLVTFPYKHCVGDNSDIHSLQTAQAYTAETSDESDNQDFPKIDHSGSSTRIVLEQNKFSKKVTSYRD